MDENKPNTNAPEDELQSRPESPLQPDNNDESVLPTPVISNTQPTSLMSRVSKKAIIAVVAGLIVLLGGGAAGALWWTSPEKSLSDAMSATELPQGGAIKGDFVVTPKDGKPVTIAYDTKYKGFVNKTDLSVKASMGAIKLDMSGGVATTANKSVLFRVNDIRDTINSFAQGDRAMIDEYYGGLLDKIDGKWVEMTEADIKDATKDSGTDFSCVMDKTAKLMQDKAFLKEASDIYKKNPIFSIKEKMGSEKIDGRDSNRVLLAYDKAKDKAFGDALEKTAAVKELKSCIKDTDTKMEDKKDDTKTPRIEVWIDKWSHKINKMMVVQEDNGTTVQMTTVINYNNSQKVDVPKADTQFKDLKSEIEKLQQDFSPTVPLEPDSTLPISRI